MINDEMKYYNYNEEMKRFFNSESRDEKTVQQQQECKTLSVQNAISAR
jgi:hypothetical protein